MSAVFTNRGAPGEPTTGDRDGSPIWSSPSLLRALARFGGGFLRVIRSAADVVVVAIARRHEGLLAWQRLAIFAAFQDRVDAAVRTHVQGQRPVTGRIATSHNDWRESGWVIPQ